MIWDLLTYPDSNCSHRLALFKIDVSSTEQCFIHLFSCPCPEKDCFDEEAPTISHAVELATEAVSVINLTSLETDELIYMQLGS